MEQEEEIAEADKVLHRLVERRQVDRIARRVGDEQQDDDFDAGVRHPVQVADQPVVLPEVVRTQDEQQHLEHQGVREVDAERAGRATRNDIA